MREERGRGRGTGPEVKNCLPVQTAAPRGSRTCSLLPRVPRKGWATLLVVITQPSTELTLPRAREQGQSVRGGRVLRAGGLAGETAPFGKFIQKEVAFAFTFPRGPKDPFLLAQPSTRRAAVMMSASVLTHSRRQKTSLPSRILILLRNASTLRRRSQFHLHFAPSH